jgi:hypothetical protein
MVLTSHLRQIAGFDPGEVSAQVLLVQIEVVKADVANDLGRIFRSIPK